MEVNTTRNPTHKNPLIPSSPAPPGSDVREDPHDHKSREATVEYVFEYGGHDTLQTLRQRVGIKNEYGTPSVRDPSVGHLCCCLFSSALLCSCFLHC